MTFRVKNCLVLGMLLGSSTAVLAQKYGMAGCGLGSMVIDPTGSQTSAATTNGSFYSQLFGITTGTSNCKPAGEMAIINMQEEFIATNLNTLSKEMAQGSGESLAAFTETLGCQQDSYALVASELKANYNTIFSAPGAMAVLDTSKMVLKGNPVASSNCQYLN